MTDSTDTVLTDSVEEVQEVLQSEAVTDPVAVLTADLQRLQAEFANYK